MIWKAMDSTFFWLTLGAFLLCLVFTLSLGISFSSSRTFRNALDRSFLLIIALVTLWNFISILEQIPFLGMDLKLLFFRWSSSIWIFLGVATYDFLRKLASAPRTWRTDAMLVIASLSSVWTVFFPHAISRVSEGPFGFFAIPGAELFPIMLANNLAPVTWGLVLIFRRIPLASTEELRPLHMTLWVTPIVLVLSQLLSGALPLLGYPEWSKLGSMGLTILVAIYYFATLSREDTSISVSQAAKSLFQEMTDGIILTDLEGVIDQINPAGARLLGRSQETMVGKTLSAFIPQFREDQWYQDYPFHFQQAGRNVSCNLTSVLQKNKGIPYGRMLILRDTSDLVELRRRSQNIQESLDQQSAERILALKEAHERIRAREQQLQSLLDNLPFQVHLKDSRGQYIMQNRLDRERRGNLLGFNLDSADLPLEFKEEAQKGDAVALKGGEYDEDFAIEENGQQEHFRSIKRPIRGSSGEIEAILGILMDVTAMHRLEQERMEFKERLLRSHKMEAIGTLAGGIAHDFNNILGALTGYCELAAETLPAEAPAQKYLKESLIAAERGRQLVQQILTFSRQGEKTSKPVAVAFTIRETLSLLRVNSPKRVQIQTMVPPHEVYILGDPVELHRIIMNLCTNALHAMRDNGGKLSVSCEEHSTPIPTTQWGLQLPAGQWICIEISDTGIGIPEENLPRIFDPFFTTKKTTEGSGLGLSVVHGLLQDWGGYIAVRSRKDEGSTFRIYLPALQRRQRATDQQESFATAVLLQLRDASLQQKIQDAFSGRSVRWMSLRSLEDIPRLWRVNPWHLAVFNQAELDLPFELLFQQWRSQGIQSSFVVFSEKADPQDLNFLEQVSLLPPNTSQEEIQTTLRKFLWPTS
ncbi:MAG TPA: ATP-binding protein [Fibrobacteraceae bacterium]|nr:ATP-binding protein [Fibrobacteraceae bacterium]